MTPDEEVAAFLAERPWRRRDSAERIAAEAAEDGVPFCDTCRDWHVAGDLCTYREGIRRG